ncbi:MAG: CopD family protein [Candidatus Brocadiae bacterium]|nr:CopD family protein [Candidatus Brocadiia bacterium]
MAFAHFFLRPSLAVLEPPQRVRLMHAVLARFFRAVLVAATLVLVTGVWIIGARTRQVAQSGGKFQLPMDWMVMTVIGVLMIAIFGHIRFGLYARLDRAVSAADMTAGGAALASIRRWVGVNLALGLAIIAFVLLT